MLRGQLFAIGVVLIGLGVPRVVDAVETAYQLDIKRDVGVLPWLVLTVVGVTAFLWTTVVGIARGRRLTAAPRTVSRALRVTLAVAISVLAAAGALGHDVIARILVEGAVLSRLAASGMLLSALGAGLLIGARLVNPVGDSRTPSE